MQINTTERLHVASHELILTRTVWSLDQSPTMSTSQLPGARQYSGPETHSHEASSPPFSPISLITKDLSIPLLTSPKTFVLKLTSHAHNPSLQPPPDLKYDLRFLPSLDRQTRKAGDSRSKGLREWLMRVRDQNY
jgi:hypothetical protein